MKKIFIIFSLFFTCIICFSACSKDLSQELQDKLSEVRFNLFCAENEFINVKFTSGFREDPYVLNGKSETKKEFGVLTVKFLIDKSDKSDLPSFVITINGIDFDDKLELNPFDQTYVQDIETFVLDDSEIQIKIMWQDFVFEKTMQNVSNTFNYNHKDALNAFIKEYKQKIQKFLNANVDFEIYVKIINDPSLEIDKNYFYVCLISTTGESLSVVIDPNNLQILAKNESNNQVIL